MIACMQLIRWKNLLMVLLTQVLTFICLVNPLTTDSFLTPFRFTILCLATLCITAGGYIVNDIFDIKSDHINKPDKVYIGVSISPKKAWWLYASLTIAGIALGIWLSSMAAKLIYTLFFVGATVFLLVYSWYLKRIALLGNSIIAVLVAILPVLVFVFGNETHEESLHDTTLVDLMNYITLITIISYYTVFSFLMTMIRELVKDMEDIDGDYHQNLLTLPIILGRNRTIWIVFFLTIGLLAFMVYVVKSYLLHDVWTSSYLVLFVGLPLLYFITQLWKARVKENFTYLSNVLKVIMVLGILSMLIIKTQ